jgi:hypothetical protein
MARFSVVESNTGSSHMPIASHTKAAADHEAACKCHTAAAELHEKGEHVAAAAKSTEAAGCCATSMKSTAHAQEKSIQASLT